MPAQPVNIVYTLGASTSNTLEGAPSYGSRTIGMGIGGDAVRITALGQLTFDPNDPEEGTIEILVEMNNITVASFTYLIGDFQDEVDDVSTYYNFYLAALISYRDDGWNGGGTVVLDESISAVSANYTNITSGSINIVRGLGGEAANSSFTLSQCVIEFLSSPNT